MSNQQPGTSQGKHSSSNLIEESKDSSNLQVSIESKKIKTKENYDNDGGQSPTQEDFSDFSEHHESDVLYDDSSAESEFTTDDDEDDDEDDDNGASNENWLEEGGTFQAIPFSGNLPGLRIQPLGNAPTDYFNMLFDERFFEIIVRETNSYAKANSEQWTDLDIDELRVVLALLFVMGTIQVGNLEDYWNENEIFSHLKHFSQHIRQERFFDILKHLHFGKSTTSATSKLDKIQPILDYFNNKMTEIYYPDNELLIVEPMVPMRFDYIVSSTHVRVMRNRYKRGVQSHALCESSGITLKIKCSERDEDFDKEKARTDIVLDLMSGFSDKGYSLYLDKSCCSFRLVRELLARKICCTGPVHKSTKGNCKDIVKAKLRTGKVLTRFQNDITMLKWGRREKDALFISSEFSGDLIEKLDKKNRVQILPLAISRYNEIGKEFERRDEIFSDYSCYDKSNLKWYIKLWIDITELLLLNSFFLRLKLLQSGKGSYFKFRLNIVQMLLSSSTIPDAEENSMNVEL